MKIICEHCGREGESFHGWAFVYHKTPGCKPDDVRYWVHSWREAR